VALINAARGGQLNLDLCSFSYFVKNGADATYFDMALSSAAQYAHLDLCSLSYFIKLGVTDFNRALIFAAKGGQLNLDLCNYLISCGARNINVALENAKDQPTKDFLAGLIQAQK